MKYNLIENALNSFTEAIHYYRYGNEQYDESSKKFCILLLAHTIELLIKETLLNEHECLIYENIDEYKIDKDDLNTVTLNIGISRLKNICKIDLGRFEAYIKNLYKVRNEIQHYKFELNEDYAKKIILSGFSSIEYIIISVLDKSFSDYKDIINQEDIDELHDDLSAYTNKKNDIAKLIKDKKFELLKFEYINNKYIKVPCPSCSELYLIDNGKRIKCLWCGKSFDNIEEMYATDFEGIISNHMERQIGRRKHLLDYDLYECHECDRLSFTYIEPLNKWVCLSCGDVVEQIWNCEDCGSCIPYDDRYYVYAQSYTDSDDYSFLCRKCAKKLEESELYACYEIQY